MRPSLGDYVAGDTLAMCCDVSRCLSATTSLLRGLPLQYHSLQRLFKVYSAQHRDTTAGTPTIGSRHDRSRMSPWLGGNVGQTVRPMMNEIIDNARGHLRNDED